ncbi:unnamed protein product [Brassica oleracea var. botrytis]
MRGGKLSCEDYGGEYRKVVDLFTESFRSGSSSWTSTVARLWKIFVRLRGEIGLEDEIFHAEENTRRVELLEKKMEFSVKSGTSRGLIENADAFAAVFPEQKYEIVKKLQELKHVCRMTGDGCSPALKRANSGINVAAATDAARGASDIVIMKP